MLFSRVELLPYELFNAKDPQEDMMTSDEYSVSRTMLRVVYYTVRFMLDLRALMLRMMCSPLGIVMFRSYEGYVTERSHHGRAIRYSIPYPDNHRVQPGKPQEYRNMGHR